MKQKAPNIYPKLRQGVATLGSHTACHDKVWLFEGLSLIRAVQEKTEIKQSIDG